MTTEASSPAPTGILAFSGSERKGSLNATLLGIIAAEAERQGTPMTRISLRDYALPIYDGDLEERNDVHAAISDPRATIRGHACLLIASPEHNGSVTALLKNALDWCSRPVDGQPPLEPFQGKFVLIVSTSISPFGGLRAIGHLRAILAKMGATVLPVDLAVPFGQNALGTEGFKDEGLAAMVLIFTQN
ncbi:MAG: NAD(P)H-dependent oxidoreductase [Rhizobiaceae bacterium]